MAPVDDGVRGFYTVTLSEWLYSLAKVVVMPAASEAALPAGSEVLSCALQPGMRDDVRAAAATLLTAWGPRAEQLVSTQQLLGLLEGDLPGAVTEQLAAAAAQRYFPRGGRVDDSDVLCHIRPFLAWSAEHPLAAHKVMVHAAPTMAWTDQAVERVLRHGLKALGTATLQPGGAGGGGHGQGARGGQWRGRGGGRRRWQRQRQSPPCSRR